MGIDMIIGEDQIRLTSATWYNEFVNWVARNAGVKKFPNVLLHSPVYGEYLLEEGIEPDLYTGSVPDLRKEAEELLTMNPPDYARWVIHRILEACEIAMNNEQKITMDDGAWLGV